MSQLVQSQQPSLVFPELAHIPHKIATISARYGVVEPNAWHSFATLLYRGAFDVLSFFCMFDLRVLAVYRS